MFRLQFVLAFDEYEINLELNSNNGKKTTTLF